MNVWSNLNKLLLILTKISLKCILFWLRIVFYDNNFSTRSLFRKCVFHTYSIPLFSVYDIDLFHTYFVSIRHILYYSCFFSDAYSFPIFFSDAYSFPIFFPMHILFLFFFSLRIFYRARLLALRRSCSGLIVFSDSKTKLTFWINQ